MQTGNPMTKEWIRNRLALEGAVAEVSRMLLSPNGIDLNEVLKIVGGAVSVDRAHIIKFREKRMKMDCICEWCDPDTESRKDKSQGLDTSQYPWLMKRLEHGENVMVPDVDVFSFETEAEKAFLHGQKIRSFLAIPIYSSTKELVGFMNFEETNGCKEWFGEEVQALRVIAEMVSIHWERKLAKEALEKSEKKYRRLYEESKKTEEVYRSLINSSADAIIISDLEGRTRHFNRAFSNIFGWTLEEVQGKEIPYVPVAEKASTLALIKDIAKNGSSCQGLETRRYAKDGRLLDVSLSASRYDDHKGRPAGILYILRDTSERRKLEAQLIQAQKMEAIGTLAGGIAHDFNNNLQTIFGFTEILLMGKDESHPDYDKLQAMENSAQRAGNLTKRLLILGRKMENEFMPVNLNQEVHQVTEILERTIPKMIHIELHLEENLRMISADPVQLEQIMMNLGVNARDAMPDGGRLIFKTENVVLDESFCAAHLGAIPGKYSLLAVSDSGHGMDVEVLEHMFEPFFTTKRTGGGTGLGLAMVYSIVKSHGGYILCSSESNRGTTFKIYLPAMELEADIVEPKETEASIKGGNETILFVEDEETNRRVGEEILKGYGYNINLASDGESALEKYKAEGEKIDLIILDLIMPGIGGRRCLERLIKMDPLVKVIISTGYSTIGSKKEIMKLGASEFISKPYDAKRMLSVVRNVLG